MAFGDAPEPVGPQDRPSPEEAPWIRVDLEGGEPTVEGTAAVELGTRLPTPRGSTPDGAFARWAWDGRCLEVTNDRYGLHPLYYHRRGQELVISPSVLEVVRRGAPADIDWDALSVFLRWGNFVGEDTPFTSVRAFPPHATARWEAGTFELDGGVDHVAATWTDGDTALGTFDELFASAMRRRVPPDRPTIVPLSGGRDSRHILLELTRAGTPPDLCVTAGGPPPFWQAEVECARTVAEGLGAPHRVVRIPPSRMALERRKNRATGFGSLQHYWYWAVVDAVATMPFDSRPVVFDGLAGDVLSAGLFLTREAATAAGAGRLEAWANEILGDESPTLTLGGLYHEGARRRLEPDRARARLVRELARHQDAPNPHVSFLFYNRTRRGVGGPFLSMWGHRAELRFPFLDHEVFDFLMGLPAETTLSKDFHERALRRAYPDALHLPYAPKNPGVHTRAYHRRHAFAVARLTRLGRRPSWIRAAWAAPRLLRCWLSPRYSHNIQWIGPLLTYLTDLEAWSDGTVPYPDPSIRAPS